VVGTARGTSASGVEACWRQGYIWTVGDGKAVRFRWFNDPREALEAVGLPEWATSRGNVEMRSSLAAAGAA
jgi:hypothetical protein